MKQFARKSDMLSIVRSATQPVVESCSEEHAVALRESFAGWLNPVAPTLQSKFFPDQPKEAYRGQRPLTATDVINVNRATIREGTAHRPWPPDVVLSFLAAPVIRRVR
jgi:hypothetical protein